MNLDLVREVIAGDAEMTDLLDDEESIFFVDWREEDTAVVEYCEDILETGSLSAEDVDADNDAGFEMFIKYKERRLKVPLEIGGQDRHITLVSLNEVLAPDAEVRLCIDSSGSDTLAFLPLSSAVWRELEDEFGEAVAAKFYRLQAKPNVFTDELPF